MKKSGSKKGEEVSTTAHDKSREQEKGREIPVSTKPASANKESASEKVSTTKTSGEVKTTSGKTPAGKTPELATTPSSDEAARAVLKSKPIYRKLLEGTSYPKHAELSQWKLVDASEQTLGRLSSHVAKMLMGKDKPAYTRFADTGDFVIVINAEKVLLTGNKWRDKVYHYHTTYPGGIKSFTATELLNRDARRLIRWAVYGMLPKGHMGRRWYKKLRVFVGPNHDHTAQQPELVKLPKLGPSIAL